MVNELTPTEARILWTVMSRSYAPGQYWAEWKSAMAKLCNIGGNVFACRDCPSEAPYASRFGGFVCKDHKAKEDALTQEART